MAVKVASNFVDQILALTHSQPVIIGISGPQGSGKLYLALHILDYLKVSYPHLNSMGMLIDDFYLTNAQQRKVNESARKDANQILQGRGLPGTHDLQLAIQVVEKLRKGVFPVEVPVYDKSAFGGEGDRADLTQWQKITAPVDVVVFEGWFNGFRSIDPQIFRSVCLTQDPSSVVQRHRLYHLDDVNDKLKQYEALWNAFDYFIYLKTDNLDNIYQWRLEQEADLISRKGTGMTPAQVHAFVDRYMPMYYLYYQRMCDGILDQGRNLEISIDIARTVTGFRCI